MAEGHVHRPGLAPCVPGHSPRALFGEPKDLDRRARVGAEAYLLAKEREDLGKGLELQERRRDDVVAPGPRSRISLQSQGGPKDVFSLWVPARIATKRAVLFHALFCHSWKLSLTLRSA